MNRGISQPAATPKVSQIGADRDGGGCLVEPKGNANSFLHPSSLWRFACFPLGLQVNEDAAFRERTAYQVRRTCYLKV